MPRIGVQWRDRPRGTHEHVDGDLVLVEAALRECAIVGNDDVVEKLRDLVGKAVLRQVAGLGWLKMTNIECVKNRELGLKQ
jgi:hypothetical protein